MAEAVKPAQKNDWSEPKTDKDGFQVGKDNFPPTGLARAMALAAAGKETDPSGIVSDEMIAAHDPKAADDDKKAVAEFKIKEAKKAAEEQRKAFEESQPSADKASTDTSGKDTGKQKKD